MDSKITVHVVKYPDRDNLVMRYKCPLTGKQVQRSTGTRDKKLALKAAAKWEAELQEGRYQRSSRMEWADFREHYERSVVDYLKPKTARVYSTTLDEFERCCRPERVGDLTTGRITAFVAELRKGKTRKVKKITRDKNGKKVVKLVDRHYKLAEATIGKYLAHLKAASRWAHKQEFLPKVPRFDMPGKASGARRMKGRPITAEEAERMLTATAGVVGADAAESWKLLIRGLWATGLRLGEAMALRWDHEAGGVSVALDGRQSVLVFDGDAQKSGKCELVPLAPEAVDLLEPHQVETGYVFNPLRMRGGEPMARDPLKIGKIISAIGKAAGVVTDAHKGTTASAHDLRRAFGTRWSKLVMPAMLKALMRHASIETTMTYYVDQDAKATAAELWQIREDQKGINSGTTARPRRSPK